mmetsp:Transcript_270/g.699  ORF Transcript_270/g.699 Transcript_270/m.699 type:complete len:421 (+) Transcript_270:131-1393(+)
MSSDTHATLLTSMATPVPHPTSRRRTCAPASLMERDTRRCETSCETRLKDLRQQARCAVAVACVHSGRELDRLAAEGAGCSVGARPLAPGDDALLAKDVRAALQHDRRSHRLLANGARVLARLEHLLGGGVLSDENLLREQGARGEEGGARALDELGQLERQVEAGQQGREEAAPHGVHQPRVPERDGQQRAVEQAAELEHGEGATQRAGRAHAGGAAQREQRAELEEHADEADHDVGGEDGEQHSEEARAVQGPVREAEEELRDEVAPAEQQQREELRHDLGRHEQHPGASGRRLQQRQPQPDARVGVVEHKGAPAEGEDRQQVLLEKDDEEQSAEGDRVLQPADAGRSDRHTGRCEVARLRHRLLGGGRQTLHKRLGGDARRGRRLLRTRGWAAGGLSLCRRRLSRCRRRGRADAGEV